MGIETVSNVILAASVIIGFIAIVIIWRNVRQWYRDEVAAQERMRETISNYPYRKDYTPAPPPKDGK